MQNFDAVMTSVPMMTTRTTPPPAPVAPQQSQPAEHPIPANGGNWFDLTIKPEPLDYQQQSHQQQHHHQHHHHHLLHHGLLPQDSTQHDHDSSPTSPQSVDSMDSLGGRSGFFESKVNIGAGAGGGYNPLSGFNPLTPPGYSPGLLVPPMQQHQQQLHQGLAGGQTSERMRLSTPNRGGYGKLEGGLYTTNPALTPTHTPPMDVTPPKSPKEANETSPAKEDEPGSDCEDVSYDGSEDEDGIRKPKVNSHGQVKKFKCKQCDFVAVTKLNFWEHTRSHIKPEKMLTCPKCPFVTEYKHHLEYHLRNHQRSKPFQCPKCSYSCVNKSMLNSHMKSHSNVFQYRCADCNYATKYCHSLKLHLRKYGHKPDVVLNLDGTPNPLPIIDVYGTRRGPKAKPQKNAEQKLLAAQAKLEKAQQREQQREHHHQQQQQQQQHADQQQAPLTPLNHGAGPHQAAPFTPPSGQPNGLMRNLFPHQLFPNPLAHMFKSAAANGNLPLFPYLNLNFQMFADQQANMVGQLSPTHFQPQNLLMGSGGDKLMNHNNNNNNNTSGSEDNDLSVKTSSSSSCSLGEELLRQITAAAADSSASAARKNEGDSETESGECAVRFEDYQQQHHQRSAVNPQTPSSGKTERSRRKGRAFKLAQLSDLTGSSTSDIMETQQQFDHDNEEVEEFTTSKDNASVTSCSSQQQQQQALSNGTTTVPTIAKPSAVSTAATTTSNSSSGVEQRSLECKYCDIAFRDDVLYTIHMGYHGYDDVFKCNMCGEKSEDRIGFFLHIARKAH